MIQKVHGYMSKIIYTVNTRHNKQYNRLTKKKKRIKNKKKIQEIESIWTAIPDESSESNKIKMKITCAITIETITTL